MENVVVCGYNVSDTSVKACSFFYIDNVGVPIGIINQKPPLFDEQDLHQNKVLVKKKAFSCNYRDKADILKIVTQVNENKNPEKVYCMPVGSEFVGIVHKIGKNIKNLKVGDRVIPVGQYPIPLHPNITPGLPTNNASKRFQFFEELQLLKIPTQVPDEVAASITISGHTIFSMIEKAQLKKGNNILITSLKSNTSITLLSALKDAHYNVYGISSSSNLKDKFLSLGVKEFFFSNKGVLMPEDKKKLDKIKEKIGGFDVVFDPFSDIHLGMITQYMNVNSKYITCGFSGQNKTIEQRNKDFKGNISEILTDIITKNISIIGNCLGNKSHLEDSIIKYISGNFKVPIDSVVTGNDIALFFDRTFNDPNRFGKVVYKYED